MAVHPYWSASGGPDTFTLRAWLGVEKAAESLDGMDASVNFMQDRVTAIFGPGVLTRFSQFVDDRGLGDDPNGTLLADEDLLGELLASLLAGADAPDVDDSWEWRAYPPGRGAERFRRAVRRRRVTTLRALVMPRTGRVAGRRVRERREPLGDRTGRSPAPR